jgi:hypothetical protein
MANTDKIKQRRPKNKQKWKIHRKNISEKWKMTNTGMKKRKSWQAWITYKYEVLRTKITYNNLSIKSKWHKTTEIAEKNKIFPFYQNYHHHQANPQHILDCPRIETQQNPKPEVKMGWTTGRSRLSSSRSAEHGTSFSLLDFVRLRHTRQKQHEHSLRLEEN